MSTGARRIVLDTNVLITIIGSNSLNRWIFDGILRGDFILCISKDILLEYEEILGAKTTAEVARNMIDFLVVHPNIERIDIFYNWNLIEADPDDNKFSDCAIAAGAFCLGSEDRHFIPVKNSYFPALRVYTVSEFREIVNI
jgi:putative PIN family toxin of toxin-antitoxin system